LEALGCTFRDHELKALFAHSQNDQGLVNIESFAARFAHRASGNNPNINPVFGLSKEVPHEAIEKIRSVLKGKGMYGVRALVQLFRTFDKDANAKLDRHEIQWVLKQNGQNLQPSEFERLFRYFDVNNDGSISISEFIAGVRGEMNDARKGVVAEAWKRIAPHGDISVDDFCAAFNVNCIPAYANGSMTKSQVHHDLLEAVDFNHDGKIQEQEFIDFYANVSSSYPTDEDFKKGVYNAWGLY
jgi:Ca2+-binding EF-hand superfamily protein